MSLFSFISEWRALSQFKSTKLNSKDIVFYAEDIASWRYFEPIISELIEAHGKHIFYVTSSHDDPVLRNSDNRIRAICIGSGIPRTVLFLSLQAKIMVMTMPDLETYHIKRSKHPVHYVYMYHSMVSSHMIYRQGAFDHFDSILCVGPHHHGEIRAREQLFDLKAKILVESGYSVLDSIRASMETVVDVRPATCSKKRVLVAPSWGDNGLLETRGPELLEVLLQAGYRVTVRPHTMTMRRHPSVVKRLGRQFGSNPDFHLELDLRSQGTVTGADIMISDWSGAALEFAFGLERPVLFVDMPRKVNNPDYERIPFVPIEVRLRSELGRVVSQDRLADIPELVETLCQNPEEWQNRIRELRSRWIYNVGSSGKIAAAHIANIAKSVSLA